ncbi:MAG: H/ACA ribonucleoprotein complex subunit GAR1 [Candidatus Nezhaarchaeota archaeon]|nr:H/ACA ribonucleoprotein complex subunit GAR1 [Candidatus Nezhaarchaeota archaeon]
MRGTITLLGSVLHRSKSNKLVVKSSSKAIPKIGEPVYDNKSRIIGSVYDIIGPVSSPYILIKPLSEIGLDDLKQVKKVYVISSSSKGIGR